jgi:hypothetical protein
MVRVYMTCGGHMSLGGIDEELKKFGDGEGDIRATVDGEVIERPNDFLIQECVGAFVVLSC